MEHFPKNLRFCRGPESSVQILFDLSCNIHVLTTVILLILSNDFDTIMQIPWATVSEIRIPTTEKLRVVSRNLTTVPKP